MNHLIESGNTSAEDQKKLSLGDTGYVYACEYSGGETKVGMSRNNPKNRIRCHDHTMFLTDRKRTACYISHRIAAPRHIESVVIKELALRFSQKTREWFEGVSIGDVKEIVEKHAIDANHPSAVLARTVAMKKIDASINNIFDGIDRNFNKEIYEKSKESTRFVLCMNYAERMEQVMRVGPIQDHADLDLIDRGEYSACSQFRLMAAITLFKTPDKQWENLFSASVNNPIDLMAWVQKTMSDCAKEYGIWSVSQ